ncbi:MAG: D-alanine--D-alanine ligase [Acidiferrobacterales bacterium]|nr:D-alanine--D-alanine ligase [Acidiferrobacterales bacterium]
MTADRKIRLGLLYGGRSCEHEVSVTSARCVYQALDPRKYEVSLLGISKSGQWLLADASMPVLDAQVVQPEGQTSVMLDYHEPGRIVPRSTDHNVSQAITSLDVIFPILHGPFGEDGTVQGLFELADVAYVGSGVTGSAVGMDKAVSKAVCAAEGIPQAKYLVLLKSRWQAERETVVQQIEAELSYPIFVKPANLGSSVGISRATATTELRSAMDLAVKYDLKVIVEEGFTNCHEIEVAVLGNDNPEASVVGEIIPGGDFYDYNDKYIDNLSRVEIPANLPDEACRTVQDYAKRVFTAIAAAGLARVDFFVSKDDFSVYINEINTMPGFTPISMYPKLWEVSGLGYSQLLDRLIELALERHEQRKQKQITL